MRSLAEIGVDLLIEAGPGDVLAKLARRALPGARPLSLGSPGEVLAMAESLKEGALR